MNIEADFVWHIKNLETYLSIYLIKHKYILFWKDTLLNI